MRKVLMLWLAAASATAQMSNNLIKVIPTADKSAVGELDFVSKDGLHYIAFASPDTVAANVKFRLPPTDGAAGNSLQTDGAKNLSFGPAGGANSINVSAAHPMQVYCHFTDSDKTHIRFSYSRDYENYKPVNSMGWGPYTENRDPSCFDDGTTIYVVSSPTPGASSKAQFWTTTDLVTISGPTTIDMTAVLAGTNADFAPEWYIDPNSSFVGIIQALSTNGSAPVKTFAPYLSAINLATLAGCTTSAAAACPAALGTSNALTLNGTAQSNVFDFYIVYDAPSAKYYKFYVDEFAATGGSPYYQQIAYATSSTLKGTYTQVTPVTSSSSVDHFGFSKTSEAPSILPLADSMARYGVADCYRVYADTWLNLFNSNNNAPRLYTWQYVDTCPSTVGGDPFATVKNQPIPVNIATSEHGTVFSMTNPARANVVYNAADYWRNGAISEDRQRFGSAFSLYSGLTVIKDPPQYFLGNVTPTTFAAGGIDPGAAAPPRSFATWSWCGVDAGSCSPTLGGEGRWTNLYQGVAGGAQVQLGNSNIDTGETSIAYLQAPFAWGPNPLVASSLGKKGSWSSGINNQFFGPIASGGNKANDWFFFYNAGLGSLQGTNPTITNPGFESGAISPWAATGGATIVTSPVHSGSYAVSSGPSNLIFQDISGLTAGTVYEITVWVQAAAGATVGQELFLHDTTGANAEVSATYLSIGEWYQIGIPYTANSTGAVRIHLDAPGGSTGTFYFDDVQIYVLSSPIGAFPLGISPSSGEVRANYGITLGLGDATSLSTFPSINLDSSVHNVLNCGDGTIGRRNCIIDAGIYDATSAFRLNGVDAVGGTSGFPGGETRRLQVQRIEPGYTNVPGGSLTLPASGTATIFSDSTGPGNVTRIQFATIAADDATMLNTRLRVRIDGTLQMDVDLGTFFLIHGSSGGGQYSAKYAELFANETRAFTHWGDADSVGVMRRIFIPYTTSCVITLFNGSGTTSPQLFTQVDYYDGYIPPSLYGPNRRVFHAVVTEIATALAQYAGIDLLPLVTLPSGVHGQLESIDLVVSQGGTGQAPSWEEGDPTVTTDGTLYQYGGTEDFFGGQFYFDMMPTRTNDYGAGHVGPANLITLTSFYRYFHDTMEFNSTAQFTWYNGQSGEGTPPGTVNVGGLVIYYTSQ